MLKENISKSTLNNIVKTKQIGRQGNSLNPISFPESEGNFPKKIRVERVLFVKCTKICIVDIDKHRHFLNVCSDRHCVRK